MIVEYENTATDIAALNTFVTRSSPSISRLRWAMRIVLISFGGYLFFRVISKDANADAQRMIVTALVVAAFIGVVLLISSVVWWFSTTWLTKRMVNEGGANPLLGERRLEISEDGLTESGGGTELRVGWGAVGRAVETDTHFFIFIGAMAAIVVPKQKIDPAMAAQLVSEINSAGITLTVA